MTTKEKEQTTDDRWEAQYKNWFDAIKELDVEKLLRADAPEYNFKEIESQVRAVISSLNELSTTFIYDSPFD